MEQSLGLENLYSKEKLLQSTQVLSHLVQQLPSNLEMEQFIPLWLKILEARLKAATLIYSSGQNSKPSETDAKS